MSHPPLRLLPNRTTVPKGSTPAVRASKRRHKPCVFKDHPSSIPSGTPAAPTALRLPPRLGRTEPSSLRRRPNSRTPRVRRFSTWSASTGYVSRFRTVRSASIRTPSPSACSTKRSSRPLKNSAARFARAPRRHDSPNTCHVWLYADVDRTALPAQTAHDVRCGVFPRPARRSSAASEVHS